MLIHLFSESIQRTFSQKEQKELLTLYLHSILCHFPRSFAHFPLIFSSTQRTEGQISEINKTTSNKHQENVLKRQIENNYLSMQLNNKLIPPKRNGKSKDLVATWTHKIGDITLEDSNNVKALIDAMKYFGHEEKSWENLEQRK